MGQFLEVMDETVEEPLELDLPLAAIGEAIEPFVAAQVGKDRFDDGEAAAVDAAAFGLVDLVPHLRAQGGGLGVDRDGEGFALRAALEAAAAERTAGAVGPGGAVAPVGLAAIGLMGAGVES